MCGEDGVPRVRILTELEALDDVRGLLLGYGFNNETQR